MKQTTIWDFLEDIRKISIEDSNYSLAEKLEERQKTVTLPEVGKYVYLILYGLDDAPCNILKSQVWMKNSKEFITKDSFELYSRKILSDALELSDYKIYWVNTLKEAREVVKSYVKNELECYNNKLTFKVIKLNENYWQIQINKKGDK